MTNAQAALIAAASVSPSQSARYTDESVTDRAGRYLKWLDANDSENQVPAGE